MNLIDETLIRGIAPTGRLRAAINLGNGVLAQKNQATGAPQGVSVALARALADELNLPIEFVIYDAAGKVTKALENNEWDVAFLAVDPVRAKDIAFTKPYVLIEGTYLVRSDAPYTTVESLDAPGVIIAAGRGTAYDLFLTRTLERAEILRADTSPAAVELFLEQNLDAAAGVRQALAASARGRADLRILTGHFNVIEQALAVPRERDAALPFLLDFIERKKKTGFIAAELAASGQEATLAP